MKLPEDFGGNPYQAVKVEAIKRIPNIPPYEEILAQSKLSPELFSKEKYREYIESIEDRVGLLKNQLQDLQTQLDNFTPHLNRASVIFIEYLDLAKKLLRKTFEDLFSLENDKDLFPTDDQWFLVEEKINTLSSEIRDLKFVVANLYTMGGYQAVGLDSSKDVQIGMGQIAQPELGTIYARYDFSPVDTENFFNDLIEVPENVCSRTLFFSSGMSSITTVLALTKDINPEANYLFGDHLYFENRNQTDQLDFETRFEKLRVFDETNPSDLDAKLEKDPQFIFVEPVGNIRELPYTDIGKILRSPTIHGRRVVIIDNTLCGLNLNIGEIMKDLEDGTIVLITSSLQKLYQGGDDLTSSGMVTVLTSNSGDMIEFTKKLRALRAMLGTNITPHNLKLIQKTEPSTIINHPKKIAKNVTELVHFLNIKKYPVLEEINSSVESEDGVSLAPVFYLTFNMSIGLDFIDRVIQKAKQRNIQIVDGASFGFKTTRMSVVEDNRYVRVCPGIENPREMAVLKEIFDECLSEQYEL